MPFAHGKPVPVRPDPVRRGLPALVRAAHVSPAPARRWRHRQQRSRPDLFRPHGSSAIAARRAATPFASAGSALQSLRALNGGPRLSPLSTALSSFLRSSRTKAPSLHPRYQVSPLSGRRRRPAGLTSVRLSNGSYSFPVSRFHQGVSKKKMRGSYRCRCSRRPVPATALARGRLLPAVYPPVSGPSRYPLDRSVEQASSDHQARVFHLGNFSASWPLLAPSPSLSNHLRQPTSPAHPAAARAVTRLSPRFKYYSAVRLLAARPFPLRLSTYRVCYPAATRERDEPSWGHVQIFRTVPFAHTLVRRVSKNAFAAIVPARPCPVSGPIHHGVRSITARYWQALQIHQHPALRCFQQCHLAPSLAVSASS